MDDVVEVGNHSVTIYMMTGFASYLVILVTLFATSIVCGYRKHHKVTYAPSHLQLLDGLRGVLACFVMAFHYLATFVFIRTGRFIPLDLEQPWKLLGTWSVPMFFCITAYLFTKKVIGFSNDSAAWSKLYIGRVFRLIPMAATSTALLYFVLADYNNGLRSPVPISALLSLATASFARVSMTPDGLPMEWRWRMAAMPQWSLHYEWLFYCTLPVLALLLTRRANWIWLLCSALVLTFVVQNLAHDLSKSWHITPFVSGVLSAVLERRAQRWKFIQNQLVPMGAGIIVFASAFIGKQEILFVVANTILMLCVITNNKGLSWLGNTRLQCLGEISFGIYIFHGIVQVGAIEVFGGQPAIHHWPFPAVALWISIQVAIVCFFANIANKYIEKPCIEFGRRLSNLLNLT